MANRVIRDWTTSETMDVLSPQAEVFFTRLIMKADDYGSFHAHPKLLNSALFPLKEYDSKSILGWVDECLKAKLLIRYSINGKDYVRIENFGQRLRNMRNTFPQPDGNSNKVAANGSECRPETKRNEVETESETETKACDFDDLFLKAFDDQTCEGYKLAFRGFDLGAELQKFRIKCDNDKAKYYGRDVGGLRTAFQYQLQNLRKNGKQGTNNKQQHTDSIKDTIRNTYGYTGK